MARRMGKDRLTALTDGVIAVVITLMVLELKPPQGVDWTALRALWPGFLSYLLSFVYVAIYWNNHHHFFHLADRVDGAVMWANLHLLFWLSLTPFATAWVGRQIGDAVPAAFYGAVLLACAIAWDLMQAAIIRSQGAGSRLKHALGRDLKGKISPALYLAGIVLAFVRPWIAEALYALVALMWLIPDRRVEAEVAGPHGEQ